MITLRTLKWDNCFSYGSGNELTLNDNTVTQIIGTNGMGKSSIPLIIEEALYNKNSKGIKKADIPNRYINDGYNIYLSFTKDEDRYEITITRKSSIKVKLEKNSEDISSHTATNTYKSIQEIIGVDLAAPGLKLAHAEAEAEGLPIHFRQEDGRHVGLPDASVDLVTGTMILHEMPQTAIVEAIEEAARLLKPGGVIRFLEFQPTGDPARDATVYEHAERNNEPYFRALFATDLIKECERLGLKDAKWVAFDERTDGLSPKGWPERADWHFPWCVLQATKAA